MAVDLSKCAFLIVLMSGQCLIAGVGQRSKNEAASLLKSADSDLFEAGVMKVKAIVKEGKVANSGTWVAEECVPLLMKHGRPDVAADIALLALRLADNSPAELEKLAGCRVKSLLAAGRPREALAASKGAFNVATMAGTRRAIDDVAVALAACSPDDKAIARRFKLQQLSDGVQPGDHPLLIDVKGESEVFLTWADGIDDSNFSNLTMRGNFYLLADKPKKAREAFERAYRVAKEEELSIATESLARVMKAEDGTIARAHAFVLSLRPKDSR